MLLRFSPKKEHLKVVALSAVEGAVFDKTIGQLLPGVNEVTENEWKGIRPNIQKEIETGEIVILAQKVSDGRGKPGGRKAKDLVQMPVNIAVNYISECMNPETLVKWYKEETREEVRIHITKKLDKLGVEIPEDDIPEAPNASPMSIDEYECDDDEEQEDENEETESDEESEDVDEDDAVDLKSMNIEQLKEMAKKLEIEGFESMKKKELIDVLSTCV